jgi:hypothetical protein
MMFVILTIITVSSSDTMIPISLRKAPFSLAIQPIPPADLLNDAIELKYYSVENLDYVVGVCANATWKSAIRLTQDEMAAFMNWTLTKVTVAYNADEGCSFVDVRIYLYDQGTETQPGPLLVNDTACRLNTTGVHTIPLITPVNLSGHQEVWVAVEWTEGSIHPYAWLDTLSGPHVPNKSDFVYLHIGPGGSWSQLHYSLPEADGRWGIGAIIEGSGLAELSIGNITGSVGITADVSNIGTNPANHVEWSMKATGGILKRVNASATGTTETLTAGSSLPIALKPFMGFGKISIIITATAQNALGASTTKSAFLLGPFVLKLK